MFEKDVDFMEYEYRVGSKYTHPDYGKYAVVKLNEMGYLA